MPALLLLLTVPGGHTSKQWKYYCHPYENEEDLLNTQESLLPIALRFQNTKNEGDGRGPVLYLDSEEVLSDPFDIAVNTDPDLAIFKFFEPLSESISDLVSESELESATSAPIGSMGEMESSPKNSEHLPPANQVKADEPEDLGNLFPLLPNGPEWDIPEEITWEEGMQIIDDFFPDYPDNSSNTSEALTLSIGPKTPEDGPKASTYTSKATDDSKNILSGPETCTDTLNTAPDDSGRYNLRRAKKKPRQPGF
ncbi:MAG: hypothetical protein M1820_009430 [Bogoriella megaspora]|nr:MAG: hypothetical protein M1820_009430 [Bogoriella megaspora]